MASRGIKAAEEDLMKRTIFTLMAGALMLGMSSLSAMAAGKTIAVSWKTFVIHRDR